jgi:hypothetical protein
MAGRWNHGMIDVVEVPFARESEPWDLTTNVVSDSCAVNYALTIRLGMGRESQLVLLPFACQRMYLTGESGCNSDLAVA